MKSTALTASTLLEAVRESLAQAGRYHAGAETAPAAILWTDADEQWRPVVLKLAGRLPQLFTLGAYSPETRTGPAIWLKCVVARTVETGLPADAVPILYLPNVSRQSLRAAGDCPELLQPLVELQYRGAVWTQRNGKDWTVEAFLVAEDGLELDMAMDEATRRSLHASLAVLADVPVSRLADKKLEAEDFDKLMVGDHPRELLEWLNDPNGVRGRQDTGTWHAFCSRCKTEYGFDPDKDGALAAAELLGLHKDTLWQQLWERFVETPALYPHLPALLDKAKPTGMLIYDGEPWPNENSLAETKLREALLALEGVEAGTARPRVLALEKEHVPRRSWVWAKIGRAPLARALRYLAALATHTAVPLGGATPEAMAIAYKDTGYRADEAMLLAMAEAPTSADRAAVLAAVRALYLPWARAAAELFQHLVQKTPLPGAEQLPGIRIDAGECILFADGLRMDLGQRLRVICEERKWQVALEWRWAALPTVTATAKPAVSPIADAINGADALPESFTPVLRDSGQELTAPRFRARLEEAGYEVLDESRIGLAFGRGWTEAGQIDQLGHDFPARLPCECAKELETLAERISILLRSGWKAVRVVTDHGWLFLPGGLPKTELPGYLVETRWSRCAAVKGQSKVPTPTVGWFWNLAAEVAVAPGISAFIAGQEYAHGGVSLQECVIPVLTIRPAQDTAVASVRIHAVQWSQLRCRITVDPPTAGVAVDIRTKANVPASSLASAPKMTDAKGQTSLIVPDADKAGTAATVVLLDAAGGLLGKLATTIGEG